MCTCQEKRGKSHKASSNAVGTNEDKTRGKDKTLRRLERVSANLKKVKARAKDTQNRVKWNQQGT